MVAGFRAAYRGEDARANRSMYRYCTCVNWETLLTHLTLTRAVVMLRDVPIMATREDTMEIGFSDGVQFNTQGDYRIEQRFDGLYVVGQGLLCAVDSQEEGEAMIAEESALRRVVMAPPMPPSKPLALPELVKAIRDYARASGELYGLDIVENCMEDHEIAEVIKGAKTVLGAKRKILAHIAPIENKRKDMEKEVF